MRLAVCSAYRDSAGNGPLRVGSRIWQAIERIASLKTRFPDAKVEHIAGEGDSVDNTRDHLTQAAAALGVELTLLDTSNGVQRFGSVEAPERLAALSKVGNAMFDAVQQDVDFVLYVESDLIWTADVAELLIQRLMMFDDFDVIAPLVMAGQYFYDIWGFRGLDGERFSPTSPYHSSVPDYAAQAGSQTVVEVSSLGSCLAMRGEVARAARIRHGGALVDWSADARRLGFKLGAWPGLSIAHPL